MSSSWPAAIKSSTDIEMRLGLLRHLFISRGMEWIVALVLTLLPLALTIILFVYCFNNPNESAAWISAVSALLVSLGLLGLSWWYRNQRKFFCICENGCAYGKSLSSIPAVMTWSEIVEIKLEEDAFLHVEENTFWGLKVSSNVEEKTRRWLHIKSSTENIRFKLSDFTDHTKLVDLLLEYSNETNINLEHERVESPELQAAKASGTDFGHKKTVFYAIGVIVFILFIVLRVVVKFNR